MESRLLGSLVEALKEVPDTRKARGQRHPFAGLLALVFLGCLCRHTEMAVLQRWADDNWDVLREPLGFTRDKPPHATTISRTLAPLDIPAFETAFVAWLGDALLAQPLAVAAVDGQTSKQGHDKDGDPIHTLNVFAHDLKVTLAQWPVTDEKATEPEVLKAHLNELFKRYPGLSLLTCDAIFCQRPLADLIVQAGRHYLFAVKDNQPDMMEAMHTTFDKVDPSAPDAQTREKKGAQVETRRLWVDCDLGDYMREILKFPGATMGFRLDREVRDTEDTITLFETRYFVCSLGAENVTPEDLMGHGRKHWHVENCLHFIKDRWWDEDRHYTTRPGLADVFAALLNMALTTLRLSDLFDPDMPMRGRADHLSGKPLKALQAIGVLSPNPNPPATPTGPEIAPPSLPQPPPT